MNLRMRRRPISAERLPRMSGTEGYEPVDGRLQEKAMGAEADWIQTRLASRLFQCVEPLGLGFVIVSECMYQCFPGKPEQIRKPDVSLIRAGRLPGQRIPEGSIPIPPDWVAEVVSPPEKADKLADKIADFESAVVPLIWVLYPRLRLVEVRARDGKITESRADDELCGEPVLPGFRARVAELFPPPLSTSAAN